MKTPFILTITGPSCAGKSTLEARLKKEGYESIISSTTRPMRAGEVDGESYYFIPRPAFEANRYGGAYIETVEFNGHLYGASAEEVRRVSRKEKPIVIVVEPWGLEQISNYAKENDWGLFRVFVDNPKEVIAERFLTRYVQENQKAMVLRDESLRLKSLQTYSSRMATMIEVETGWKEQAEPFTDLYLPRFDETNIEDVIFNLNSIALVR